MRVISVLSVMLAAFGAQGAAAADNVSPDKYPHRPVRWIVPYTPAGTTDILARIMSQWLTQHTGQQFVVDNRPGAGNNIGTELAVKAAPDGYTVFLVNPANAINATLYINLNFNFIRDIAPVAGIARVPNVMTVNPKVPANTVAEFIAYAKENPGKVNMASSGNGTSVHLSGELFMSLTGTRFVHVPYKGGGPAMIDLLAGNIHLIFATAASSISFIKAGKTRALAVSTAKRSALVPDLPTVAEAGLKGFEANNWNAFYVPTGTPRPVMNQLNKVLAETLYAPDIKEFLFKQGLDAAPGTPEELTKYMRSEYAKWGKVIKAAGLKGLEG